MENLVILVKGLYWCGAFSAETGNEDCGKEEAFRVEHPRLRRGDGNGARVSTCLGFEDSGRSSGSN